jgi:hypothetical protein
MNEISWDFPWYLNATQDKGKTCGRALTGGSEIGEGGRVDRDLKLLYASTWYEISWDFPWSLYDTQDKGKTWETVKREVRE